MSDNNELIDDILKDFKLMNDIEDTDKDSLYTLYIKKSIQTILNLTNRIVLPEELKYVVLDMVNEFYNEKLQQNSLNIEASTYIKQVSEEGRTVQFGNMSELQLNSLLSAQINYQLSLRTKEIYRYRLLYKVKGKNGKEN